jgi:hypothetical protein
MPFLHFEDFSKGVTDLLTEGFKPGVCDVTLTKSGGEESLYGPHVVQLARETESGGIGGMAQTSVAKLGGKEGVGLSATVTPDATLYATLRGEPAAFGVDGLNFEWQAMLNPIHGAMPIANLDLKCFRDGFTAAVSASPMQGLSACLTTGTLPVEVEGEGAAAASLPVMAGTQVCFAPNGKLMANVFGVTLGGMLLTCNSNETKTLCVCVCVTMEDWLAVEIEDDVGGRRDVQRVLSKSTLKEIRWCLIDFFGAVGLTFGRRLGSLC